MNYTGRLPIFSAHNWFNLYNEFGRYNREKKPEKLGR